MNRYPLWKYILIALVVLVGAVYMVPNFYGQVPAVQVLPLNGNPNDPQLVTLIDQVLSTQHISPLRVDVDNTGVKVRLANTAQQLKAKDALQQALGQGYSVALNLLSASPAWMASIHALPMYLGLDLRGGVHFLLQVDMQSAMKKSLDGDANDLRSSLRRKDIHYSGVERNQDVLVFHFQTRDDANKALQLIQTHYSNLQATMDEDSSGFVLNIHLAPQAITQFEDYALQQNITTLRNRVNELGVAEPIIQQQGTDRIVVELPGIQDTAKAKDILGRTASLEVHMVDEEKMADPNAINEALAGNVPFNDELRKTRTGVPYLLKKNIILTGDYITDASPGMDGRTGLPVVNVSLDGRGARIFKEVTRDNVGKRMAIVLVGKNQAQIVTAPVIQEEIDGGRVQISGMRSVQEATDTALLLRAGSLAAPMEIVQESTVGPSLGADNIKSGFDSTLFGFLAIIAFMIIYYRVFGVIASIALAVNLMLLVAVLSMLQATLSLPGIAGMALTVGMAIDANVLIFERIREELRNGSSPQSAIHAGYDRAMSTIVDSNITTLIAGIALFWLGSGPVRGFAVTLCIGILTSMFSGIMVSRAMVNLIYGRKRRLAHISI
ncbi:MAG: protein translocase subunit SecD [Pseudomonadota bacterium]|nr:protein translocase subunit SecD [Pseudomonadota bacterium]